MNLKDIKVSGFTEIENQSIYFYYENNKITFCFPSDVEINSDTEIFDIIGVIPKTRKYFYFRLSTPLQKNEVPFGLGCNVTQDVDYFVENIKLDSNYNIESFNKIYFNFQELDHFLPSCNLVEDTGTEKISVERNREIESFTFNYCGEGITAKFFSHAVISSNAQAKIETKSFISFSFKERNDIKFVSGLYRLVFDFFSFIYNRTNLSLERAFLFPKIPNVSLEENPIFHDVNLYQLPCETSESIKNPCLFRIFRIKLKELFQVFIDKKHIADSIHPSRLDRNQINKRLYLTISAAFEYLTREDNGFVPKFISDKSSEIDKKVKDIIIEYADAKDDKGVNVFNSDGKKKIKAIAKKIDSNDLPLSEKIKKIYSGYSKWEGITSILSEWFSDDNINELALITNEWRNEYAHEKRASVLTFDVVKSIRLLEHINYSIILRFAGYSDRHIKEILDFILIR